MTRMIQLDQLRSGHEARPPINARKVGRDDGIAELAASIGAHGLITPLKVVSIDGVPFVGIGNRRLMAMRLLVEQSQMAADAPVRCEEFDPVVDDAREVALAEQIMRAPLHEADQHEEFRALADAGLSEKSIASRFGIEPRRVKKILALGRLSPLILDWWRAVGDGHNDPDGVVRAFTLAPSITDQERVFKKLKKAGDLYSHSIKREFGAGNGDVARNMKFVGVKAYVAAGGTVVEDLFGDDHAVSDPALAAKLVEEKLRAKCAALIADGWSWAELRSEIDRDWNWKWTKLPVNKAKATDEHKAQSGCVVDRDWEGKLEITYGVIRPETAKKEAAKADGPKEKRAPSISNALTHRLSIQATLATRKALSEEPRLGLVALLAGFLSGQHHGPIKVSSHGRGGLGYERESEPFSAAVARLSAMSDPELFRVAAGIAGEAIDLQCHNSGNLPFAKGAEVLGASIAPERMMSALRETFDAPDYFAGVAKPLVIEAIREAINEDEARKADKLKKAELVAFAVENVAPTSWLPPLLRTATYSGPGEIPIAEAAMPDRAEPDDDDPVDAGGEEAEELDEVA